MVRDIQIKRLEWLGHLIRLENNRIPVVALIAKLEFKRKVGRPKLRWINDIQADLKMIGIKGWRGKTQDRLEWMDIITETDVTLQGS